MKTRILRKRIRSIRFSGKTLIAGAGYLGLRVAERWERAGIHTSAITRSPERAEQFRKRGLHPIELDLSEFPQDLQLPQVDVVLWAVGYDRSSDVPREKTWLDGLRQLVRRLSGPPNRFIYVSSTGVYGEGDGSDLNENAPLNPITEGGRCCAEAESLLRAELPAETELCVLRMAGIYGPDRLLRRIDQLRSGAELPGDGDQWLNLIHVDDGVRMIEHVASADEVPDVVNVVNSGTLTRQQYYATLAELTLTPPPVFAGTNGSPRPRSGNKRIVSQYCGTENAPDFQFDDVREGLRDALERSSLS